MASRLPPGWLEHGCVCEGMQGMGGAVVLVTSEGRRPPCARARCAAASPADYAPYGGCTASMPTSKLKYPGMSWHEEGLRGPCISYSLEKHGARQCIRVTPLEDNTLHLVWM
jgi:hypothetical protein